MEQRPQSVPEWLSDHKPRRSTLPPRAREVDYQTEDTVCVNARPRAPIVLQSKAIAADTGQRRRRRQRGGGTKKAEIREQLSLDESLECLEHFDKTNRGRELSAADIASSAQGEVHFVNIDEQRQVEEACLFSFQDPLETSTGNIASIPSTKFRIPELPRGRTLMINILSTWGDPFYVGLMGVEVFDHSGHLVRLSDVEKQLASDPPDLNGQNQTGHDPRTIDKIVDGHYNTCDELHSWLAPFQEGGNHFVYFTFDDDISISMIRIWNYNTSRIHSYRGARYVEVSLDDTVIFKGEIRRASGTVSSIESNYECILFTTNESILHLIEKYDVHTESDLEAVHRPSSIGWGDEPDGPRPKTGDRKISKLDELLSKQIPNHHQEATPEDTSSPLTTPRDGSSFRPKTAPLSRGKGSSLPEFGQVLKLFILENWGDPFAVGLTSLQVLDSSFTPIRIPLAGVSDPPAGLEPPTVLFNGNNVTTDPSDMWMVPLELCGVEQPILTIDFTRPTAISAFKIWNYNVPGEDSARGAKRIVAVLDGRRIGPPNGYVIRKAMGNCTMDCGQFILVGAAKTIPAFQLNGTSLSSPPSVNPAPPATADPASLSGSPILTDFQKFGQKKATDPATLSRRRLSIPPRILEDDISQQYQTPLFPRGCIIKILLLTTWGDRYYIGLNGLEVFDENNESIEIQEGMIEAEPRDINVLDENDGQDVRTLDKLYNKVNNTYDDSNMWLSPYYSNAENQIFVLFDEPITISRIMLWNYSKTPTRGVRDYEIYLDDVLIYRGILKKAPELDTTILGASQSSRRRRAKGIKHHSAPDMGQSILFTDDASIIEQEKLHLFLPHEEDTITFFDNDQVIPTTQLDNLSLSRPSTSAGSRDL